MPEEVDAPAALVRRQAVPPQPVEGSGGADAHLQPGEEPTPEQGGAPKDGHDSVGKPVLEQSVPEGLQPTEGTHIGAVHEELQPMGSIHVGEVHGGLSPMGETPRWSRGRVRSPAPEEDEAAETMCDELTPTPIPCPPVPLGGGGRENREWS